MSDLPQEDAMNDCTEVISVPGSDGLLESLLKRAASTSMGQTLLRHADTLLWTTEKCAQWSMPQTKVEDAAGKLGYRPELVRPLPWILFLPALLALRALRVSLSLVLLLLGKHPLLPATMVRYIQSRRRRLRAIKFHGCRNIRLQRQAAAIAHNTVSNASLLHRLTGIVNSVICIRQANLGIDDQTVIVKNSQNKIKKHSPTSDKRKFHDIDNSSGSDDLTDEEQVENFLDMVTRLAAISDAEDPDYTLDSEFTEDISEDISDVDDENVESDDAESESQKHKPAQSDTIAAIANKGAPPPIPVEAALPINNQKQETTNGTTDTNPPPLAAKKPQEEKTQRPKTQNKIAYNGKSGSYKEEYRPYKLPPPSSKKNKESLAGLPESDQIQNQTLTVETEDQFYSPASSSCASPEPIEVTKTLKSEQLQTIIKTERITSLTQD